MNFRDRPRSVWAFPLVALGLALAVLASDWNGWAQSLRGTLFDAYQRESPRPYKDTRATAGYAVRVLDIDAAAIAKFGAWPWPHAALAKTIQTLRDGGAELVVVAAPLDKPDPASPKNLIAAIPPGPGFDATRTALEAMPSADKALAVSLTHVSTVTGFMLGNARGNPLPARKTIVRAGNLDPFERVRDFAEAAGPIISVARVSAGLGALNLKVDGDGVLRRMPLVLKLQGRAVPTLDAEALRVAENKKTLALRAGEGGDLLDGRAGAGSVEALGHDLPTAPDGSLWLAFAQDAGARTISAAALDDGTLDKSLLKNAIVYIGAPDDLAATPFGLRPTAQIHAEALENMLLGTVLRRPGEAGKAELACLILSGLAAIYLLLRFGVWWAGLFASVCIAGAVFASWHLFQANGVLLDSAGPSIALALVFASGAAARFVEVSQARGRLHSAFADSLSAESIERIARKPSLLKLEGETRNVSYLVCGVRGFARLADSFRDDPVAFTRLLQRVFAPLMDTALAHRGTVERVTSEGFSCFWNAPLDDPEHAVHACEAASAMMEAIARINDVIVQERRIDGAALAPVEIGIGVSTGPAIAGGFRTHGRTTYTATGDCALEAARIQALSATYGPAMIVSEDTRKAAERGFAFLEVDFVALTPGDDPVKLYAMLGNPVMRASPKFRALSTFHDHIFQSLRTQQWDKARELIDQCRKLSGASQKLYDLQLDRIQWLEAHPPGPDWDGAFRPVMR
jgi:adenylate cyclase